MTIIVTGFDAFAGAEVNSSQLVIDALAETVHDDVITAVLPTSYRKAGTRIRELIRMHRPKEVLMLGLADGEKAVLLEQVALNLDDCASPDNDGDVRLRQRIKDDAPIGYWSSLPLNHMAEIAWQLGQDIGFSHDAGGFVCNHVFFTAAHVLSTELPECICGLVHLPFISGPGEKLTQILEIVQAWIADGPTG